jgi:hypothetical protein
VSPSSLSCLRRLLRGFPRGRFDRRDEFQQLDPEKDHQRIYFDIVMKEFPWDISVSVTLSLYRDFAVPGISAVLARTGKMEQHTRQRIDDTKALLFEIITYGFGHPRGVAAVRRVNRIHNHVARHLGDPGREAILTNDQFIYVLGSFFIPSIRWIDKYGWRSLSPNERTAMFSFYRELGRLMGIKDIPSDCERFIQWFDEYERQNFRYADSNKRQWEATCLELGNAVAGLLGPRAGLLIPVRPVVRLLASSVLGEDLRTALGAPRGPAGLSVALRLVIAGRGKVVRWMPPRLTAKHNGENFEEAT